MFDVSNRVVGSLWVMGVQARFLTVNWTSSRFLCIGRMLMSLGRPRNEERDLEILEAALAGTSLEQIAERFNLSFQRVQAIVTTQRHKVAVSPHATYRSYRQPG